MPRASPGSIVKSLQRPAANCGRIIFASTTRFAHQLVRRFPLQAPADVSCKRRNLDGDEKRELEDRKEKGKWNMYVVEVDQSKRLLVLSAAQRVTAEQAKQTAQRVRELLENVAPGFRVLADFRWLDSMDSAAARHLAEIMDALAEKQVASVTRVVPDPHKDIGLNILSQFHYGPEIQITTFETLADALQSLAGEGR
jgi:anti-anti-sigma regulatory factor